MITKTKSVKVNAVLNIIKQCCNIVFPLITYTYVSRTMGLSSLGRYSFADSVIQYAIILATLGASGYAIREGARIRDDKEKVTKLAQDIISINILSLLFSVFLLVLLVAFVPKLREEYVVISILSVNLFATVFGRDWLNSIYEDFLYITIRYVLFQLLSLVLIVITIKAPEDLYKYTVIMVISFAGAQIANLIHSSRIIPLRIGFDSSLMHHIKPIMFMFCISVASIIYINSDITMLGFLRTDAEVGTYYMTGKIYTIIKTLMNAIITVSIPRLSYYLGRREMDRYYDLLVTLKKYLFTLLIPCIVGLFMLSNSILEVIGGEDLLDGTIALRILCLAMLFAVFGSYFAHAILIPNRKEVEFFKATIISALINIALNTVFIPLLGIDGAALTTLVSEFLVVLICAYKAKGLYKSGSNRILISVSIGSLFIVIICVCVKMLQLSFWMEIILSVLLSIVGYAVILIIFKNEILINVILRIFKKNSLVKSK